MKILIINAILYTAETKNIPSVNSIKDTMIYDLCLSFKKLGYDVCLLCAEDYKPVIVEEYDFDIIWGHTILKSIFMPHRLPFMKNVGEIIDGGNYDLIISSEVFSMGSLVAYLKAPKKTIIWHELAKHNALLKKVPSKIWYNIIAKVIMRNALVVARSKEAFEFISRYCKNTKDVVIDHGINSDKFAFETSKSDYFIVCSQLIERKRIDGIIDKFAGFMERVENSGLDSYKGYKLFIVGDGELREELENRAKYLNISNSVAFTGKLSHDEMIPLLSKAKALLINTLKDNSMISVVESIAVGTPVIMTDVALNASYVKKYELGIVDDNWGYEEMYKIIENNKEYVDNCGKYRYKITNDYMVELFIGIYKDCLESGKRE